MDYREVLIDFMYAKANKLKEHGIDPDLYFNHKDERIIKSWSNVTAEDIWNEIRKVVFEVEDTSGLRNSTCPFCIFYASLKLIINMCTSCEYKDNHKRVCDIDGSDFSKILRELKINPKHIFTNQWYRDTIIRLENKYRLGRMGGDHDITFMVTFGCCNCGHEWKVAFPKKTIVIDNNTGDVNIIHNTGNKETIDQCPMCEVKECIVVSNREPIMFIK